ncbi:RNA-directed DNA polymerase [Lichenihabitans psoromatis]|uniref:RNA-directed DNA polymerase n=1 Tax=Lichenihabitans psoromatis TaxID=2528642 RepID=UPI0013F14476|nr:RNA-directed DNA polymerase [Lichenihabitans psoromatis]
MEQFYRRAIKNIVRHGDTDIFPFPIENHVFHDLPEKTVEILTKLDADVVVSLGEFPPTNVSALAPVGYTGFRWALQIDPIWNIAYLSWVLSIADQIEAARLALDRQKIFSYRYSWNEEQATCFNRDITWRSFIDCAVQKAASSNFVVSCDISEFYPRINHHRIENAIQHLPDAAYAGKRIKAFLSNLSGTYSFGIPVGGPASRLIAELVLSQIDSLLLTNNVDFLRYADDYYIFANSPDECFKSLVTLTRLLFDNQGLQLQKSKTRIMSSTEFIASNPLVHDEEAVGGVGTPLGISRQAIMAINLHYDPYSPNASEDYEELRQEIHRYPVIELIRAEIKKSRVDVALSRRLVSLSKHLEGAILEDAILTLVMNHDILYPVYHNVLITAKEVFDRLSDQVQVEITAYIRKLIDDQSRVMVVELNLQYAVRVLALRNEEDSRLLLGKLFRLDRNVGIKRDIILALARWSDWHWLSDLKTRFRQLSAVERRGFMIASFELGDEGDHWRKHVRRELSPMEELTRHWANDKHQSKTWNIPL